MSDAPVQRNPAPQLSLMDMGGSAVAERLRSLDLNSMTPFEALGLLYELKKEVDAWEAGSRPLILC